MELIDAGSYSEALSLIRSGLSIWGEDPFYSWQFQGLLGLALLRDGQPAEAIPPLENAVRGNELDPGLHRNLAQALLQTGRKGRALTEYQVTVELVPADPVARLEYGQLLTDFRAYDEAREQLLTAARLCGECIEAQEALARLYLQMRRPAEAVRPLRLIWEADPAPVNRQNLLAALAESGQDSLLVRQLETIPESERSVQEWSLLVEAEIGLPSCEASRRAAMALADPARAESLPEQVRNNASFWAKVALTLLEHEEYAEGLLAAERSVLLDPDQPVYRNNLAVLLNRLGRDDEARKELEAMKSVESSESGDGGRP